MNANGRVVAVRNMGRVGFFDLRHDRIESQVRYNPQNFARITPGLHVRVIGEIATNRRGQELIAAEYIDILGSGIMPEPVGAELRRRFPERHWLTDSAAIERMRVRSRIVRNIRTLLDAEGFEEIETPILQRRHGGGDAEAFITQDGDGREFFLRQQPELYLKRAVVGGIDRVYEIGRNFRNEGRDRTHSPEFTSLEVYEAYATWTDAISRLRQIVGSAFGHEVEMRIVRMDDLVAEITGLTGLGDRELLDAFDSIESNLVQATIVTHFPVSDSPLAEADPEDPRFALRFELYANSMELANGYQELRDAGEHRCRLGDRIDPDYLDALQWGLPPTAGLGIGIDRLVQWQTNTGSIRDAIAFPNG